MEETIILICQDSLEGIYTGIYEAYALRIPHEKIELQIGETMELRLFVSYREIVPDGEKAQKVSQTLQKRFGEQDYHTLCMALSSSSSHKAQAVYRTVVWGLSEQGRKNIMGHLSDDNVRKVMELARQAGNELHHLMGFLRFNELDEGILYAVMKPQNDILVPLAEHFADRLPGENFIIFDEGRNLYAIHPAGKEWFLVDGKKDELIAENKELQMSAAEKYYQELFRHFCHSISIESRKNFKLQQNMLPLRFRPYMVEFTNKS